MIKDGEKLFAQQVRPILKDKTTTRKQAQRQLQSLIQRLQVFVCQGTATFLPNALPDESTCRRGLVSIQFLNSYEIAERSRVYAATSVLERGMRGINPLVDVMAQPRQPLSPSPAIVVVPFRDQEF